MHRRPPSLITLAVVLRGLQLLKRENPASIAQRMFPHDSRAELAAAMLTRSAQAPAVTNVPEWAGALVTETLAGFLEPEPGRVYGRLFAYASKYNVSSGQVRVAGRTASNAAKFAWIGEADPIPAIGQVLSTNPVSLKKLAAISTFTRELFDSSAIAQVVEDTLRADGSAAVDAALMSANAATDKSPAGLLYNVPAITGTDNCAEDIKALIATVPNLVAPAFICNIEQTVGLAQARLLWEDGTILGWPVIFSDGQAAGSILMVDSPYLLMAEGGAIEYDLNDQTTLHEEDTDPQPIIAQNNLDAAVASSPVRSLWQTYAMAARMVYGVGWTMVPGHAAQLTGATW